MALAREISWQPSTDVVISEWSYAHLYEQREQTEQTEIENTQFEEKKSTLKCDVGAKKPNFISCAQGNKV